MNLKELNNELYIENIDDESKDFFIWWGTATKKLKNEVLDLIKEQDKSVTKSNVKLRRTLDEFYNKNKKILTNKDL